VLCGTQRLAFWTQQHAIGLEREILTREASRLPGQRNNGGTVALHWRLLDFSLWRVCNGRSKLGGAQRLWLKLMPQFESQVPDPLCDYLPSFLAPGGVAAPAIRVKLFIFVRKNRLKGTTMQIQLHHITGGECLLRKVGEEEFVDDIKSV